MAQHFSQADIDGFKECFNLYAKSGVITTSQQLALIMRSLGMAATTSEVSQYLKSKGGEITFPVFLDVIHIHRESENAAEDILNGFKYFDTRKKGEVTCKDLRHLLATGGEKLSKRDAEAMFREANIPTTGCIKYRDFIHSIVPSEPMKRGS